MSISAAYNADLARVVVTSTAMPASTSYVTLTRSDPVLPGVQHVVRPTKLAAAPSAIVVMSDYEFTDDAPQTYTMKVWSAANALLATYTTTITPSVGVTWLKWPLRPFLNLKVAVTDWSDVTTPGRGTTFDVIGRRLPIAVTDVRGSRRYSMVLRCASKADAALLENALSSGDVAFLQPPADCVQEDQGWYMVGDVAKRRSGRHDDPSYYLTLQLTECDAPDSLIPGYTATYASIAADFATYADLAAAFATYADLAQYVASPQSIVVG